MVRRRVPALKVGSLAAVVTLAVTLASGCSSSASSANGSASSASTTGATINIGQIGPFSGALASTTAGEPGALAAWADAVNAAGGLDGRHVKVISMDTSVGTEPGLQYAQTLIQQDHVVAIVDGDGAPDDATWLPYAAKQGVPVIVAGPIGYVTPLTDADAFPVQPSSLQAVYAFAAAAKSFGPKFGYVYCAEDPSCAASGQLLKSIGATIGLSVPVDVSASSSAPDYTAYCQDLVNAHVNSWYPGFASAPAKRITDTCYQQGLHIPQVLTAGTASPYWHTDPAFYNDPVIDNALPYFASATPAEAAYRNDLQKYSSGIIGTALDNAITNTAWLGGQLISAAAATTKGPLTAASLTAGLYSLKNETLGGLVQPLNFVRGKPTVLSCNFVWKINSNGNFVPGSDQPVCPTGSALRAFDALVTSVTKASS